MLRSTLKRATSVIVLLAMSILITGGQNGAQAANTHSMDFERSSSQYLSISDASQTGLDITGDMTIETWVKVESSPGGSEEYTIVAKWDADNNGRSYAFNYGNYSGTNKLVLYTSSACNNFSNPAVAQTLTTGTWYHVAVSKSGTTATFYVNGSSIGTGTADASLCNSSSTVGIGGALWNSSTHHFDGLIDDVRVWNLARTGIEISDDKSRELNGNETGLVGYWKLNNVLTDSTANGNTMTNNGSAVHSADSAFSGFTESLKVRKTSDESVASSTVLQNDDQLKLSLAANKSYIIDGVIFASSTSATPDILIAFFGQSDVTVRVGYTNDVNEMVLNSGTTSSRIVLPANTPTSIHIKGTVKTSATSGDFQLKWAQATSNANPTTVMEGSYLKAEEI